MRAACYSVRNARRTESLGRGLDRILEIPELRPVRNNPEAKENCVTELREKTEGTGANCGIFGTL